MPAPLPLGVEFGAVYELVGPDGTRAVLNDSGDPDFVGFLVGDSAVTGLERASVREVGEDLAESDGGVHGSFLYSRLTFSLSGMVDPTPRAYDAGLTEAQVAALRQAKLKRATNAMRGDATLKWTPSSAVPVQVRFRQQQPIRITNRRPKAFLIAGVAERESVESQAVRSASADLSAMAGGGVVSPVRSPVASAATNAGALAIATLGDAPAWPTFTIRGPIVNPVIRSLRYGVELRFAYTLGDGEALIVDTDPRRRTILLGGTADRFAALDWNGSTWFPLAPGDNDLRVGATSYSAGASVTVAFRDAWG